MRVTLKNYNIALVGATGLVGREFIRIVESRGFPAASLTLLASDRSAGRTVPVDGREVEVQEATPRAFDGVDIAVFAAGQDIARHLVPAAVGAGAIVIDTSPAFRTESAVPLVVPEINPEDIERHRGIIANPNCSTVQLSMVLHALGRASAVRKVVVSTYQSVSGTGVAAVEELTRQTKAVLEGQAAAPHVYPHQIAFNILPEVDVFLDNGYTREEWKLSEETRKVLHNNDMVISATCVRVPVYVGHCQAVHVEMSAPLAPDEARRLLAGTPGIKVLDDPSVSLYPQPRSVAGSDDVFVGRIRQDMSGAEGLVMWVVADNLRKGTALNAVQIIEEAERRGALRVGRK